MSFDTAVFDGDWLCFMASCTTHPYHYILYNKDVEVVCFDSETKLNKYIKSNTIDISEGSDFHVLKEKRLIANWEKTARSVLIAKVNKLKREAGAKRVLIAMGRTY